MDVSPPSSLQKPLPVFRTTLTSITTWILFVAVVYAWILAITTCSIVWLTIAVYCSWIMWRGTNSQRRVCIYGILVGMVINHTGLIETFTLSSDVKILNKLRIGINPSARAWIANASEPVMYNGIDIRRIEILDAAFFTGNLTTQLELVTNIVTPIQAYTYIAQLGDDDVECVVTDAMPVSAKVTAWRRCFIIDAYITRKANEYFDQLSFLNRWSLMTRLALYTYTPHHYITSRARNLYSRAASQVYRSTRIVTATAIRLIAEELCVFVSARNVQVYGTNDTVVPTPASTPPDKPGISLSSLFVGAATATIPREIVASLGKDGFLELEKWICGSAKKHKVRSSI